MPKQLTIDEMLTCAKEVGLPGVDATIQNFEALATILARELANHLRVQAGAAYYDLGIIAAPFYKHCEEQVCPYPLDQYDPDGGWAMSDD